MTGEQSEIGRRSAGVTLRALVIAFVLLVGLSIAAFYESLLWKRDYAFTSSVPPSAQLNVLLILTAAMMVPAARRVGLTRRELLAVYSVLLVSAPIVSLGILYWMLPKSIVFYYLARANPAWQETLLPHLPWWFAPSDLDAVDGFFVGKAPVPWALWYVPMAAWLSYAVALFVAASCLLSLLQRQWVRSERLSYPMAALPLEVVATEGAKDGRPGRLSKNRPLWAGVAFSFAVTFLSGLSTRIPSLPQIPLGPITIMQRQNVGPLAGLGAYEPEFYPWLISLAYLIPKELSFSCWFFWLVRLGLTVISIAAGHQPQDPEEWFGDASFPAPYYQGTGAILALGIWGLWTARKHLSQVLRAAVSRSRGDLDADEPIPYRLAVVALVLSTAYMVGFYWVAGCRWTFGLVLTVLTLSYYVMWARLRAETGLGFLAFPQELGESVRGAFGTTGLRPRELVALAAFRWSYGPGEGLSFDTTTANLSDTFKIADVAGMNRRRLMAASLAALVFALVMGWYIGLRGTYRYGFLSTAVGSAYGYPWLQTKYDPSAAFASLVSPEPMRIEGILMLLVGGLVSVSLGLLRTRFWWWPFHPLGYLAANCWGWSYRATAFFMGWLGKTLVIRYGGLRLYRQTVPLAIGLIVGDILNRLIWIVATLVTQGRI
jgi:hypothetical protein